LRVG